MKNIMLLGSTGSIGTQTLEVVRRNPDMKVVSLAAHSNITLLKQQIDEFAPELVCVYDEAKAVALEKQLLGSKTKVVTGMDGLIACATLTAGNIVVAAVVGMIGIRPGDRSDQSKKRYCFCKQRNLSDSRAYYYAVSGEDGSCFFAGRQ